MATYESKKYAIPGANISNIDATAVAMVLLVMLSINL